MAARPDVAVIGGGMLGMTLALRLAEQGTPVTLLEAEASPGGLAAPDTIGGFQWDRFYHVMLLSDLNLRRLLADVGLGESVNWKQTRTGFYGDGRLHSFSSSLDFARFPLLSLADKARLAATILRASRVRNPLPLEQEPVETWLRRWSGDRVVDRVWLPLLKSKLGDNYRIASAAFIWAIIARMYAARRSGLKKEMFGYVDGGYARIISALRARLLELGVQLQSKARVADVSGNGDSVSITLADGRVVHAAQAVLTLPCPAIRRVCPWLTADERERLDSVVYQGIICASVLLRRPLAGYYVTNIVDAGIPFTGVIEMTALVDAAAFDGRTLVYLPRYLAQDDAAWGEDDAALAATFMKGLQRMYPDLADDDVLDVRIARARQVLAVSTLDYSSRCLPQFATSTPNVFVANSAQIAHGTLNVNETIAVAESAARMLTVGARRAAA
ncbi:MAG TPA: NAD(P)/FAD-dependent oxidoreductase [Gemmatimonadales bacterium]|nr:NAD(P)/FAD-dependent oxidoreductase [Gemmatimonadales bacterium]